MGSIKIINYTTAKMIIYFLSKLLPIFFLPLGLSCVFLLFKLINRFRWSIFAALSMLWIFSMGIVSNFLTVKLQYPWIRTAAHSALNADAIVVLSGGGIFLRGEDKVVEWNDPDRFLAGIDLYRAGKAQKLFFTGEGDSSKGLTSGQIYIREALKLGIPKEAMQTTSTVRNTRDEALRIKEILSTDEPSRKSKVLLVTSAFHMSRAKRTFERQGISVIPFPVDFKVRNHYPGFSRNLLMYVPKAENLSMSSLALREFLGRLVYRAW